MTPAKAGRDRQRWLGGAVLATGVAVFTVALAFRVAEAARTMGALVFDWTFYSAAVQRWLAGEPIYPGGVISTLGTAAGASYAYPPSSVPLMLPFASWPLGAILWEACLLLVFWTGVWTVIDRGWPDRRALALGIALLAAAFFQPVLDGFAFGNVNIATAGALAWVWTSGHGASSGCLCKSQSRPWLRSRWRRPTASGRSPSRVWR